MSPVNRATNTYWGEPAPAITPKTITQVIRESAGQEIPPGAVPEDRVAPSTTEGDVTVTVGGKTVWQPSESLSGVIAANAAAAAAANDAAAAQDAADTVATDLLAHLADTSNAHDASAIRSTAVGGVVAVTVQDAIQELDTEKVAKAGDTMTGSLLVQGAKKTVLSTNSLSIFGASGDPAAKTYIDDLNGILFGPGTGAFDWGLGRTGAAVASIFDNDLQRTSDATADDSMPRFSQVKVMDSGLIIPSATDVKTALRQVEDYVQNLEERFEQHHHDERYRRKMRWSPGFAPTPTAAGDYVQAYTSAGITTSIYFAPITGSYAATGAHTLAGIDLMVGSKQWRIRTFFNISCGDSIALYSGIYGANLTGIYGLSSPTIVGPAGLYPEGTDAGTLTNPLTVGGAGHRMYPYVGAWVDRGALVASGYSVFGTYHGRITAITSIGWYMESGIEIETY